MRKLNGNILNRTGQEYGFLTAVKIDHSKLSPQPLHWICECICGNLISVRATNLASGNTKSCGCTKFKGYGEISQGAWYKIVNKAQNREIDLKITIEEAWDLFLLQNRTCVLSGIDLCFVRNIDKYWLQTASLDRIDSNIGYELGNIQWLHKEINQLKADVDNEEFIFWCNLISNRNRNLDNNYVFNSNYIYKKGKYELYKTMSMRYWTQILKSAKRRNIPVLVSHKQAYSIFLQQNKKCAITDVPITFIRDFRYNAIYQTASLDRIDSSKPYSKENIQWVHKRINRIKHKHTLDYVTNWAKLISTYQDSKNATSNRCQ